MRQDRSVNTCVLCRRSRKDRKGRKNIPCRKFIVCFPRIGVYRIHFIRLLSSHRSSDIKSVVIIDMAAGHRRQSLHGNQTHRSPYRPWTPFELLRNLFYHPAVKSKIQYKRQDTKSYDDSRIQIGNKSKASSV